MKKIISLILSLILVFAAIPFTSFAEETEKTDIDFATSLGFIKEEEPAADEAITRIQLAEIFFNIVFDGDTTFSKSYDVHTFSDVPEEKKHIVATVYDMGIMRGYSDTIFAPDDNVTFNQLIKTFVSFLGYDAMAQFKGGYPMGYLNQAAVLGILPSHAVSGDSIATIGAAANLLKKSAAVDFGIPTAEGGYYVEKGTTYLKYYKEITIGKGTVTGNYLTNIADDGKTNYFSVFINNEPMHVGSGAAGIQDKLGYEVYIYYQNIDNVKTIVYFEESKSSVLDIPSEKLASVYGNQVKYYEGFETISVSFAPTATVVYNGSHLESYTDSDLNPFNANKLDGSLRLIDKDFDGTYDTVVVTAFSTYVVDSVTDKKIFNKFNPADVVDFSKYRERNIDFVNVIGEPIEPETIKEGHIINVCYDKNKNVKKIIVSMDAVSGIVEEVSKNGTTVSGVKLSGTMFSTAPSLILIDSQNRLSAGIMIKAYFNCLNRICYIDVDGEFINGYTRGLVVDFGTEGGIASKALVRIFGQNGEMNDFTFADRVHVNGTVKDSNTMLSTLGIDTDGKVKRQIILYKTDVEVPTIINNIVTADTSGVPVDGFYQFLNSTGGTTFNYKGGMRTFNDSFSYDSNSTVVFSMPSIDDRNKYEDYTVTTMGTTEGSSKSNLNALIYGTNKDGLVADTIVIDASDVSTTITDPDKRPTMLIDNISEVFDAETGTMLTKVNGIYIEGTTAYTGGFTCKEEDLKAACGGKLPQPGDIYRWQYFRSTGNIKTFNATYDFIIFDKENKVLCNGENPKQYPDTCTFNYGKVIEKNGSTIKVELYNSTKDKKVYVLNAGYYKIIECKADRDGDLKLSVVDHYSIKPATTHASEASDVIVFHRASGIGVFVFN